MVAPNHSGSPNTVHQSMKSTDPSKSKRARTKHACDECRRSQKKCDGDKPMCRRCYLNGTFCSYTPHKSRNQCLCTGQSEEAPPASFTPDVFVFADPSLSSFHTWSATSSPDQSPGASESLLKTPPPTDLGQEPRFGRAQNAVLELPVTPYESEIIPSPDILQRNRDIYNHRSYSLPNFSSTGSVSPSLQSADYSSCPVSASLPRNFVQQTAIPAELRSNFFDVDEANKAMTTDYLPTPNNVTFRDQGIVQRSAGPGTFFDISTRQAQQAPEVHLSQRDKPILTPSEAMNLRGSNDQIYDMPQYVVQPCSQSSMNIAEPSLSTGYSSSAEQSINAYSQWLAQVHANGIPSSHARLATASPPVSQELLFNGSSIANRSFLSHSERSPGSFTDPGHAGTHDFTSLTSSMRRSNAGMALHDIPPPQFSHGQWVNVPTSPPLSGGYASSANPSPPGYGANDLYDWSH